MIEVVMPDGSIKTVQRLITPPKKPIKVNEATIQRWLAMPNWKQTAKIAQATGTVRFGGNAKINKSVKKNYQSCGLMLAPNAISGHNVCPKSTPGCRAACIFYSGLTETFSQIKTAQIAKTRALFQNRAEFDRMLLSELTALYLKHPTNLVCRLNVLSDLPWERMTPWLFEKLPDVQFYDYTKRVDRMLAFCRDDFPPNYHLCFSRSEINEADCHRVLEAGGTVTVVFRRISGFKHAPTKLPETYWGYPVIDGDLDDTRFLDTPQSIIGLKAKGVKGQNDKTGFVVNV